MRPALQAAKDLGRYLELDYIPAGMELFPAADEDQWALTKSVIDAGDYYIVILGGRYGSLGTMGKVIPK